MIQHGARIREGRDVEPQSKKKKAAFGSEKITIFQHELLILQDQSRHRVNNYETAIIIACCLDYDTYPDINHSDSQIHKI